MKKDLNNLVNKITESYKNCGAINHVDVLNLPSRAEIQILTLDILSIVFPGFYTETSLTSDSLNSFTKKIIENTHDRLVVQVDRSLRYACKRSKDCLDNSCTENAITCARLFFEAIPEIRELVTKDVDAAYKGDPACFSHEEVIVCYPGIFAVTVQRLANILYKLNVPLIPRIMTEFAHQQTGVDIHPGANIGEAFFMDHATGVVIGETVIIGKNVKLYQGVTLGAKSFPSTVRDARGKKRHPTIEDNVVIYANATILGDITIGKGAVIGGNTWITNDVAPETTISIEHPKLRIRNENK